MIRSPRVIAAARVLAGLSQAELADAAGVPRSVLQALETGRADVRNSTLIALIDTLAKQGVRLLMESDRIAWGIYVERGSEAAEPGWGRGTKPDVVGKGEVKQASSAARKQRKKAAATETATSRKVKDST